ncbi:MAG TPA: hypothetical protein VN736_06870 [Candidatus Limnocylindrales bacterium]|nr:hypothetical protein [Candidatus Limnocylindrales bacterium]
MIHLICATAAFLLAVGLYGVAASRRPMRQVLALAVAQSSGCLFLLAAGPGALVQAMIAVALLLQLSIIALLLALAALRS